MRPTPATRALVLLLPFLGGEMLMGQSMSTTGMTMIVREGTRVSVEGPVQWTLSGDATVVNHGLIELGTQARVVESAEAPITGSGTETAWTVAGNAAAGLEPGGLGLRLSAPATLPALMVRRGHLPLLNNGIDQSIARWYALDPAPPASTEVDVELHYAGSELNGLNAAGLSLFQGDTPAGPWTMMPGGTDPAQRTVSATWSGAWNVITAFPAGITTGMAEASPPEVMLWPVPAVDVVHLQSMKPIERLELLDAMGRQIPVTSLSSSGNSHTLQVGHLAPGGYLLRINGRSVQRLLKQ